MVKALLMTSSCSWCWSDVRGNVHILWDRSKASRCTFAIVVVECRRLMVNDRSKWHLILNLSLPTTTTLSSNPNRPLPKQPLHHRIIAQTPPHYKNITTNRIDWHQQIWSMNESKKLSNKSAHQFYWSRCHWYWWRQRLTNWKSSPADNWKH